MQRLNPSANLHRQVVSGGLVFTAGVTASDKSGDITQQAKDILGRMDALLSEAGASRSSVISATIYLVNLAEKSAFNAVWQAHFAPDEMPARTAVGVADLGDGVRLEISMIAAVVK